MVDFKSLAIDHRAARRAAYKIMEENFVALTTLSNVSGNELQEMLIKAFKEGMHYQRRKKK